MKRTATTFALMILAFANLAASCSGSSPQLGPTGSPCKSNGDCRSNTCGNNVCVPGAIGSPCAASADCQSNWCLASKCADPVTTCDGAIRAYFQEN